MLREIVDKTALRIDKELAQQPEVQAELRLMLAQLYFAAIGHVADDWIPPLGQLDGNTADFATKQGERAAHWCRQFQPATRSCDGGLIADLGLNLNNMRHGKSPPAVLV